MNNQQSTIVTSEKYSINWRDVGRAFIITAITAFISSISQGLEEWLTTDTFEIDKVMLIKSAKFAFSAGLSYVILNYFNASKLLVINPPEKVINAVKEKDSVDVAGEIVATKK